MQVDEHRILQKLRCSNYKKHLINALLSITNPDGTQFPQRCHLEVATKRFNNSLVVFDFNCVQKVCCVRGEVEIKFKQFDHWYHQATFPPFILADITFSTDEMACHLDGERLKTLSKQRREQIRVDKPGRQKSAVLTHMHEMGNANGQSVLGGWSRAPTHKVVQSEVIYCLVVCSCSLKFHG